MNIPQDTSLSELQLDVLRTIHGWEYDGRSVTRQFDTEMIRTMRGTETLSPVPWFLIAAELFNKGPIAVMRGLKRLARLGLVEQQQGCVPASGEYATPSGCIIITCQDGGDGVEIGPGTVETPTGWLRDEAAYTLTAAGIVRATHHGREAMTSQEKPAASKSERKRGPKRVYDPMKDRKLVDDWQASNLTQREFEQERGIGCKTVKRAYDRVRSRKPE